MDQDNRKGRRAVIRWLAVVPVLPLAGRALAADGKARKADMQYQDKPKDGQDCDDCIHFVPGKSAKAMGQCQIVEGPISPNGWCIEFQPKKKGT